MLAKAANADLFEPVKTNFSTRKSSVQPRHSRNRNAITNVERPPPIRQKLLKNDLESIIDEEILNKFRSIRNRRKASQQVTPKGSQQLVLPQKHGRTSPHRGFKIELVCSRKHGIKGQLPVGMNHRFAGVDGQQSTLNITRS